jgi:hypothetical protein
MHRGEIWRLSDSGTRRPVLVIQANAFNRSRWMGSPPRVESSEMPARSVETHAAWTAMVVSCRAWVVSRAQFTERPAPHDR